MKNKTRIPTGLYAFIIASILIGIYYFVNLLTLTTIEPLLKMNISALIMWTDIIFTILFLIILPYGILKQKNYARNFAIIFLIWSIFWSLIMIFLGKEILTRYILFVIMMIFLIYLLLSPIKNYFNPSKALVEYKKDEPFQIGGYTLYKQNIKKKDGDFRTFYYFSKTPSEKGEPASKPDNYKVKVNPKTGVPYLKKEN